MVKQTGKTESTSNTQSNVQSSTESKAAASTSNAASATDKADAIALLSADHRKVEQLFQQYTIKKSSGSTEEKKQLIKKICTELSVHTILEEQIFYPACREKGVEDDMLDEAQVEHDGAKMLMEGLLHGSPDDDYYDAKVKVLEEYIKHHVKEEEQEATGIFAKAKQAGVDMKSLGEQIQSRKPGLLQTMETGEIQIPPTRSFNSQPQQENVMNRQPNERERNSRGQFESGDRNQQSAGRYRSYDHDDEGSGGGRGWYGDPEGHSRSSQQGWENRGGGSRGGYASHEGYGDNYGRGSRGGSSGGRGQGGWFGDSEGHSRASQEGWENRGDGSRGGYSSREDFADDYSRQSDMRGDSRGGSSGGRGQSGWYGDSDDRSRASQEGWESRGGSRGGYSSREDYDDDRRSSRSSSSEGRGWYGDPEGHARAAEEGWEHRGGSHGSGGNGGHGRSSNEGRGHGGWFGDPEGHSQAARQRGR